MKLLGLGPVRVACIEGVAHGDGFQTKTASTEGVCIECKPAPGTLNKVNKVLMAFLRHGEAFEVAIRPGVYRSLA